jgi:hypothetical protein
MDMTLAEGLGGFPAARHPFASHHWSAIFKSLLDMTTRHAEVTL